MLILFRVLLHGTPSPKIMQESDQTQHVYTWNKDTSATLKAGTDYTVSGQMITFPDISAHELFYNYYTEICKYKGLTPLTGQN